MKKEKIITLLSLASILLITGCRDTKRPDAGDVVCQDLYLYVYDKTENKFIKGDEYLKTYFFNKSSIPYFSLKDYVATFLTANSQSGKMSYSYSVNNGNAYITLNNDNKYKATATINADAQTITYDSYSGYNTNYKNSACPLASVMLGGEYLFKDLKYAYQEGNTYKVDLNKYNLKAYYKNNEMYLPFSVCNTALGSYSDNLIYNGNGFYSLYGIENDAQHFNALQLIRNAIANNAYDTEYQQHAYDHLALTFDHYFGLDVRQRRTGNKEDYKFFKDGAYKSLEKYKNDLMSTSPDVSNNALLNFYNECVNDGGHSEYDSYNIFATKKSTIKQTGDTALTNVVTNKLREERTNKKLDPSLFGEGFTGYIQTIDNVLFVTMDEFMGEDKQYTKDDFADNLYGKCAISILGRANEEVQKNKNIKNVVLDMSCNLGGYAFMPLQILSWINKGQMNFIVKNNMDNTVFKGSGHADVNFDGTFDAKDYLADDVNVYFICSPCSFSSGNYVNCLASEVANVKFIGERSGGGSCNIAYKPNALGSEMRISGNIQLCFNKEEDGKIVSDERGVIPTYYPISLTETDLSNAPKFYDRQAIVNKILGK